MKSVNWSITQIKQKKIKIWFLNLGLHYRSKMRLLSQTACLPLQLSAATERMERGNERERRKGERKKPGKRNHDHLARILPDPGRKACAHRPRETLGGSGHPCPPAGSPAPPPAPPQLTSSRARARRPGSTAPGTGRPGGPRASSAEPGGGPRRGTKARPSEGARPCPAPGPALP